MSSSSWVRIPEQILTLKFLLISKLKQHFKRSAPRYIYIQNLRKDSTVVAFNDFEHNWFHDLIVNLRLLTGNAKYFVKRVFFINVQIAALIECMDLTSLFIALNDRVAVQLAFTFVQWPVRKQQECEIGNRLQLQFNTNDVPEFTCIEQRLEYFEHYQPLEL